MKILKMILIGGFLLLNLFFFQSNSFNPGSKVTNHDTPADHAEAAQVAIDYTVLMMDQQPLIANGFITADSFAKEENFTEEVTANNEVKLSVSHSFISGNTAYITLEDEQDENITLVLRKQQGKWSIDPGATASRKLKNKEQLLYEQLQLPPYATKR